MASLPAWTASSGGWRWGQPRRPPGPRLLSSAPRPTSAPRLLPSAPATAPAGRGVHVADRPACGGCAAAPAAPSAPVAPAAPAAPAAPTAPTAPTGGAPALTLVDVRRLWPDLLERVKGTRRFAWMVLSQHAQAVGLEGRVLTLGFNNPGARQSFVDGNNPELVRQALIDLVGADLKVEAILDPAANPGAQPVTVTRPSTQAPAGAPVPPAPATPPSPPAPEATPPGPPAATDRPGPATQSGRPEQGGPDQPGPTGRAERAGESRAATPDPRPEPRPDPTPPRVVTAADDAEASRSDDDLDHHMDTEQMLTAKLGAQVIEEIPRG